MAVPVPIYLAFNAGGDGAHGWGAAMSTDTAFALGVLALVAPRRARPARAPPDAVVIDDLVALLVIATVYTDSVARWRWRSPSFSSVLLVLRFAPVAGGLPRRCCWASACGSRCSSPASTR